MNEQNNNFDNTLSEISKAYEDAKDVLNALFEDMTSEEFDKAMDGITKLRNSAASLNKSCFGYLDIIHERSDEIKELKEIKDRYEEILANLVDAEYKNDTINILYYIDKAKEILP